MSFDNSTQVLADAWRAAQVATSYADTGPADPEAATREAIRSLEPVAPSVGTAGALLTVASVPPVPVDRESLEPTADPLTSLAAVEQHYRARYTDGAGVRAGVQSNGSTIFAVHGSLGALRQFRAEVGTEQVEKVDERGRVTGADRSYRPTSPFVTIRWSPPAALGAQTVSASGLDVDRMHHHLRSNRRDTAEALEAPAWLAWTAAPDAEGKSLVVKSHKLGGGIEVVGAGGVVPWHVVRGNGWTAAAQNMPIPDTEPISPWLVAAVGGSWKAARR